jgi:hypothetical protein
MIPQLVTVGHRRPGGRWRRLYVPVLPVVLVLSPLLLLAVLGGLVACLVFRVSRWVRCAAPGDCCGRCPAPGSRSSRAGRPSW